MTPSGLTTAAKSTRILYCHCAYARVVPNDTKNAVLKGLASRDVEFDAVPDLCEMAARKDPRLLELAAGDGPLSVAACYPRAVKWLFASAGVNIDRPGVVILNMRTDPAEQVLEALAPATPELVPIASSGGGPATPKLAPIASSGGGQ